MKRILNGEYVVLDAGARAELPVAVSGAFETLQLRAGRPDFLPDHWVRFEAGCRWSRFSPPIAEEQMRESIQQLAAENGIVDGVVRFAAWQEPARVAWCLDVGPARAHMAKPELVAEFGPPLAPATPERQYKHLNRTVWRAALEAARARGSDEALLFDPDGRLVEGCVSNVFFVRDGILHTPALRCGPLPGVLRARVIAMAKCTGWQVSEAEFTAADLDWASEIWLTNSLVGVKRVGRLGQRIMPAVQPMLDELRRRWREQYSWDVGGTQ